MNSFTGIFQGFYLDFKNAVLSPPHAPPMYWLWETLYKSLKKSLLLWNLKWLNPCLAIYYTQYKKSQQGMELIGTPCLLIIKEWWNTKFFLQLNEFFVYVIFFFQFRITWLFCNVLPLIFKNLFDYLFRRFTLFIDVFDTLLIIILFLVASLCVCLLTLRLSINIKHLNIKLARLFWLLPSPPPPITPHLTRLLGT